MIITENWFDRLIGVLSANERSMRAVSLAAGKGPNYISQMIKDGKQPSTENLSLILDQFDRETALFILTGIKLQPGDLEVLQLISRLPVGVKKHFHSMLLEMQDSEVLEVRELDYD